MRRIGFPFMRTVLVLVILCSLSFSYAQEAGSETVYYFIRHAEKDRSNPQNKNPELLAKGKERAEQWARVFNAIKFDAVYATDYKRTQQTAAPTAAQNQVMVTSYDPRNFDMDAFKKSTSGKTVLIVGHSNTTPMLVNAFLGHKKYAPIEDNNNANLYIVTILGKQVTDLVLRIE